MISDERLRELWRSVNGPRSALNGPLIRYAGLVAAAVLDCGLSANDVYHVMLAWEQEAASLEQTRIVTALGRLRERFIQRGDSPFVQPLTRDQLSRRAEPAVDEYVDSMQRVAKIRAEYQK